MESKTLDQLVSKRISLLRYVMIIGIVILHVPPSIPLAETGTGVFDFIKAFFAHAVFRSTVPVLTCISGYLLFKSNLDKRFILLIKKKAQRLILPLFIWNFPFVLILYVIQSKGFFHDYHLNVYPFTVKAFLNGLFSITEAPVNYPLFFLRDLFVLGAITPVLGFFLRRIPWSGLFFVLIIFWIDADGCFILRNSMPVNFYIGGMAAVMGWNLVKLDRFAFLFFLIFIIVCVFIVVFRFDDYRWIRLLSPFMIWPFFSILANSNIGKSVARLSKYSYFIFLSHLPVMTLIWLLYQKLFGNDYYIIFWVMTPLLIAFIGQYCFIALDKVAPTARKFLIGEGSSKR